jgi:cytochrome c oxidase cbb3-type subunit 3
MRHKLISRIFFFLLALLILNLPASAQGVTGVSGGIQYFLYAAVAFVLLAFIASVYFITLNTKYQKAYNIKKGKADEPAGLRKWWSDLDKKFFTKAAPLEKEADVLMDHDYDGIKELDNALPPWWKWGFYFTIVVAVLYMFRFHVWETGPTPEEEYNKEMAAAEAKMEGFRKSNKESIDEKTVTLADATGLAAGKKIFTGTCFPCHGANGEGNAVGPNLTDKYWLHGGSLGEIFHTITVGVPDKGMQAWSKTFSPADIKNLASFVLSLQGTNPPNAKAPQGNLYSAPADSVKVKKDTSQRQPIK